MSKNLFLLIWTLTHKGINFDSYFNLYFNDFRNKSFPLGQFKINDFKGALMQI